ncbi:MAG: WYL domain-containing protein [Planctomycetota bacterium]|nr:MAG: WYL domain-containing protein [Planctomycetota bacterium]
MHLVRIRRLLQLLGHLQTGRGHNARALSDLCRVSRRTIFRDLDLLRDAGVPLHYDVSEERFRIPGTFYLPPTNFTTEEALAVIVLCHEVGHRAQVAFFDAAKSAAAKLESSLPAALREQLARMTRAIHIRLGPLAAAVDETDLASQRATYQQLVDAIARRRAVRIRYDSFTERKQIATKLSPYRLWFSRRAWYVIGRSSLHRATRTFHLGRILSLVQLDDGYQIPRGFNLERYLRNAWHMIPERGPNRRVSIRFSKLVARNVADVAWHKTQRLAWNADGSLDFQVNVSGLGEVSWWVLGYGDQALVLEPPELAEIVVARAKRMLARYKRGK